MSLSIKKIQYNLKYGIFSPIFMFLMLNLKLRLVLNWN